MTAMHITTDHEHGLAYIRLRHNLPVHETRELVEGAVFADYDRSGTVLVGIEILAPGARWDKSSTST